ncbi:helix-turn-helix domain-containing protein [Actinosynnema sp. NPDC059335]|uniref:helix-turn-helix domain-containing protein n=1 Tax=Actinosynnema sp. NPDC059335 TaxID=3346804 RepID=UPI00366EC06F
MMSPMTTGEGDPKIPSIERPWPLGEVLRTARRARKLSMREAAAKAGFSVTTWSAMESGMRKVGGGQTQPARPEVGNVIAAAKVVGVDHNEALHLLDPATYDAPNRPSPAGRPTVSERELARKVTRLSPWQRWLVNGVVDEMLRAEPDPDEPAVDLIYRGQEGQQSTVYFEVKHSTAYGAVYGGVDDEGRDSGVSRPAGEETSEPIR